MTRAELAARRQEIERMRTAGMSHQRIAECVGVSVKSVQRTLRGSGLTASFGRLRPRQKRLVVGVAKGLTKREAAVEAGYSPATARSGVRESAGLAQTLREAALLRTRAEEVAEHIHAGIHATRTEFFAHQGKVRDERQVVDFAQRKGYIELYAKVTGALKDAMDVNVPIQVVIDL